MSALLNNNPALYGAVMWHGVHFLKVLRPLPRDVVQKIADEASQRSLENPLHMMGAAVIFEIPSLEAGKKFSGAQVLAVMVFALWILCGESYENAAPLVDAWPIREAVTMADVLKRKGVEA